MSNFLGDALQGSAGPVLVILSGLSIMSIALIILKVATLWRAQAFDSGVAEVVALVQEGAFDRAASVAGRDTPVGRVLNSGIDALRSEHPMESALQLQGRTEVTQLARHLKVLEGIAVVSPLLGLLGTVLGMIEAFRALELAGGGANAAVLAGGIWQALLTTAAGLGVAIPALFGTILFTAQVDRMAALMEDSALALKAADRAA
ncbi:MAG: MotA/TolQ/ExbB proton channel family protein [Paracoccaceae bacterium]|nr:MotA/TolQ/ExbB proton channel family protein [Paracoccaceae bacterium]